MPLFFGITDDTVEQYLYRTLPPRPAEIQAIEDHATQADVPVVGPLEGQFLYVLALGAGARDILEVGTATGYSAAWLGLAARARGGRVVGLERDPARAALATGFWRQSGLDDTCSIRPGDAFAVLRTMDDQFDFIFVDILTQLAGPAEGELLADLCIARLHPGGLLVADNALRKGRIADPANREPGVETMRRYRGRLDAHPDFATVIVPLRDGVALAVRHPD
jgi:predicted O-methyltransferase YrrM